MPESRMRALQLGTALSALALLAGCGGGSSRNGGGVISTPAPQPTPTPVPTPTPTPPPPPPVNFDTAEFRRSDGPDFHNALAAWQRGITGRGSTIAIVDTGIDADSPEFRGRIAAGSADVAGSRGIEPEDDHGTNVALVAAAARNNTGVVGIAFDSTILALRADTPGSCATEDPEDPSLGCNFAGENIAAGIDRATAAGATVINLSLGGGDPGSAVTAAIRRAVAAGIVIIVSAGNDGESTEAGIDPSNPDPFARGVLQAGGSNVIIVGSVNDAGQISSFSNKAGAQAGFFLTARGERICCVYQNGEIFITTEADGSRFVTLFSGTSFSAPQVTGAVALLKQAFPNLTGRQIVEILLETARDAGAAGVDAIYGRGILDIGNAFSPQGTTTLAGTTSAIPLGDDTGIASGPMGDALSQAPLEAVLLDKYQRAYVYDLGSRLRGASVRPRLHEALATNGRRLSAGSSSVSLAFTVDDGPRAGGLGWTGELRLSEQDAQQARVLAAQIALKIDPDTKVGFAFSEGAGGLVMQMQGRSQPAFLVASAAGGDSGFARSSDASVALRRQVGDWGVTLSAETGEAWLGNYRRGRDFLSRERERFPTQNFGLAADRRFGPVAATLGVQWLREDKTILGAYFHDALGASGADSLFVDAQAAYGFAPGWSLGGALRQGFTRAHRSGTIADGSEFASRAWSFDLTHADTLKRGDSLGLRLSQPLRVTDGGLALDLPVSYDYATVAAANGIRRLPLAPEGRELTGEIAWRGPLWNGDAAASVFYRRDPGHYASLPDDRGVAIRWNRRF